MKFYRIVKRIIFTTIAIFVTAGMQTGFAQMDSKKRLNNIVVAYLDLKNALIREHADSTHIAARRLFYVIDKMPVDSLSGGQRKTWAQFSDKLRDDAVQIKNTTDMKQQHAYFDKLSANIFKLLKELKINTAELYYQYCPMANDQKGGYWISETPGISNPYMAKTMPSCGATKEVLKPGTK